MFDLGTWPADQTDDKVDSVRLWVVPAHVGGNWNWTLTLPGAGKVSYVAIVDQVFQQADAAVRVGKNRRASRLFTIRGDQVAFSLTMPVPGDSGLDHDFTGTVRGDVMTGKVKLRGELDPKTNEYQYTELPWRATRSSRTAYFARTGLPNS
jgi:hypothetical protein